MASGALPPSMAVIFEACPALALFMLLSGALTPPVPVLLDAGGAGDLLDASHDDVVLRGADAAGAGGVGGLPGRQRRSRARSPQVLQVPQQSEAFRAPAVILLIWRARLSLLRVVVASFQKLALMVMVSGPLSLSMAVVLEACWVTALMRVTWGAAAATEAVGVGGLHGASGDSVYFSGLPHTSVYDMGPGARCCRRWCWRAAGERIS